jgi:hypothetical protein
MGGGVAFEAGRGWMLTGVWGMAGPSTASGARSAPDFAQEDRVVVGRKEEGVRSFWGLWERILCR